MAAAASFLNINWPPIVRVATWCLLLPFGLDLLGVFGQRWLETSYSHLGLWRECIDGACHGLPTGNKCKHDVYGTELRDIPCDHAASDFSCGFCRQLNIARGTAILGMLTGLGLTLALDAMIRARVRDGPRGLVQKRWRYAAYVFLISTVIFHIAAVVSGSNLEGWKGRGREEEEQELFIRGSSPGLLGASIGLYAAFGTVFTILFGMLLNALETPAEREAREDRERREREHFGQQEGIRGPGPGNAGGDGHTDMSTFQADRTVTEMYPSGGGVYESGEIQRSAPLLRELELEEHGSGGEVAPSSGTEGWTGDGYRPPSFVSREGEQEASAPPPPSYRDLYHPR